MKWALYMAFLLILSACSSGDRTDCTGPRPEMCISLYEPVCGSDGKTYSNSCTACSNPQVSYHTSGECT